MCRFVFVVTLGVEVYGPFRFFIGYEVLLLLRCFRVDFTRFVCFYLLRVTGVVGLIFSHFRGLRTVFSINGGVVLVTVSSRRQEFIVFIRPVIVVTRRAVMVVGGQEVFFSLFMVSATLSSSLSRHFM